MQQDGTVTISAKKGLVLQANTSITLQANSVEVDIRGTGNMNVKQASIYQEKGRSA